MGGSGRAVYLVQQTEPHLAVRPLSYRASTFSSLAARSPHRCSANHSMVRERPSLAEIFGSQPKAARAREMSGQRCLGSSCGSGLWIGLLTLPESLRISPATSPTVYSVGLPMFTGRTSSLLISLKTPSTRSSTYCTLLVWLPSP